MMPARYVKPYVKRNKNDAADAEAICEAVTRPTMRFVPVKTVEQQSVLMIHRTRQLFVRQRTSLINAIRAHLAEFGIVAGVGRNGVEVLLALIAEGKDERVPPEARDCLTALAAQLDLIKRQILGADRRILAWHRSNSMSKRLEAIPGIGPLGASALVASIPDPHIFRSGRDVSAWIGRSTVRSRCPNRIPAAARNVSGRSRRQAIDICENCWSSVHCPSSNGPSNWGTAATPG